MKQSKMLLGKVPQCRALDRRSICLNQYNMTYFIMLYVCIFEIGIAVAKPRKWTPVLRRARATFSSAAAAREAP
jgi:hypothetical protein